MRPVVIAAIGSVAVIATISYLTYSGYKSKSQEKQSATIVRTKPPTGKKLPAKDFSIQPAPDKVELAQKVHTQKTGKQISTPVSHPERNEFVYDPTISNHINAKQGTQIIIPDNAFVDAQTGSPVTSPVIIKVDEYYRMDDIFFNDLHTMSDSGMLETNGMIHVRATANKRPCKLASDKIMTVSFPLVNNKKGMQLFVKDENAINAVWRSISYTNTAPIVSREVSDKEKAEGSFPPKLSGDINSLKNYIDNSVKPGYSGWSGTMEVEFVVNEVGYTTEIKVLKEIHKDATAQIGVAMSKLLWKRGFRNFRPARYKATLAFQYKSGNRGVSKIEIIKPFEYAPYQFKQSRTESFAVSSLGWINCDRFIMFTKTTNLYISDSTNDYADVKIIFNNYKSILPAILTNNQYGFNGIPADEPITVVAVKKAGNNFKICLQQTNTSAGTLGNFTYRLVSRDELKQIILALDKISTPNPANTTAMR